MNDLMIFEEHEVEVFELNGEVLFNPYHVGECLELSGEAVRKAVSRMNEKQVIKVRNSDVTNSNIRKLNNAGENFLTESGVYKLVFKSRKPNAEKFTDWVTDEVLPTLRKTGYYEVPKKKEDKKEKLPSVNQMVKNIKGALHDAGVDSKYISSRNCSHLFRQWVSSKSTIDFGRSSFVGLHYNGERTRNIFREWQTP